MTYAMPVRTPSTESEVRSRPLVVPCPHRATARVAANEEALRSADDVRRVEPMLLVHQERAETFRLIAAALRDGYRMLARSFAH